MKNNKGFTLIELLAVIAILIILSVMITKQVGESINRTKEVSYNSQIEELINASKMYISKNANLLNDKYYMITMDELKKSKLIANKKIINPKTNEELTGCIAVTNFEYAYVEDCKIDKEFDYTGEEQTYDTKISGYYKLETWGAQGGTIDTYRGGYGGYSVGIIKLNKNAKLYINVGGKGEEQTEYASESLFIEGGYNGGGKGHCKASNLLTTGGGGATHIATISGILSNLSKYKDTGGTNISDEILLVASGGAGAYGYESYWWSGNSGGGFRGGYSNDINAAATQTSGYAFGQAGISTDPKATNHSGGGGGWYGGYSYWGEIGAGGGSSYIGNPNLIEKSMFCYNCEESNEESTKTISTTGSNTEKDTKNCPSGYSETPISKCAKTGNGYARITYIGYSKKN